MKVALVLPTLTDPAHLRVGRSLTRELGRRGHMVRLAAGAPAFRRLLRGERFDVCHVQFFSRGLAGLKPADFPSTARFVLTHQGASLGLLENRAAFFKLLKRAERVTAVSKAGLKELKKRFPGIRRKATAIYNGTEILPECRPAYRRPYILSVGRLAAYKGTDVLLLAFAALGAAGQELVLCGPDQTGGRMRRFAGRLGLRGRVRFLGARSPSAVERLLRGCSVFVLPSRAENCPMALLEAMAAGKACVASAVGGVPELIRNGRSGLLVRPGEPKDLSKALARLLGDERLRERLGSAASRGAKNRSWAAAAREYERIYD